MPWLPLQGEDLMSACYARILLVSTPAMSTEGNIAMGLPRGSNYAGADQRTAR
jgi:hypothetical protein